MKTSFSTPRFALPVAALLLLHGFTVAAVTFTTDTLIGVGNNTSDLGFLRKGAGSARKLSSREMDLLPLAGQEGDRA
jgi:hypothetical protein